MMSTKQRLVKATRMGFFVVLALTQRQVWGADSPVPAAWNVAPMRDGAYLEAFDGASLPVWAGLVGMNTLIAEFPAMAGSGLPARANAWFDENVKVMKLETAGEVVTNTLAYAGGGNVTFASQPVYVDMRIRFDAVSDVPDSALLENVKLALFVSPDKKLVVVHNGGVSTNATELDTNKWHQVTVKLLDSKFDVLMNDVAVFSDLTVKSVGTANVLASANFYGTGLIDELYVSHGDPAYAVAGPTSAIPELPVSGGNPPTPEQQTRINAWLAGKAGLTSLGTLTRDQLSRAFLLGELPVSEGTASEPGAVTFGIEGFDLVSPTRLLVTARLETGSVAKDGQINGRIQLQGKVNYGDAEWTTLGSAVTPSAAEFTAGKATYTFDIPEGGYKFFRPLIVP